MSTTLPLLPVEVLHFIFDCLDYKTILCSVRPVCTQLYAVVNSYDRYVIDARNSGTTDLKRYTRLIRPGTVISLTLSWYAIEHWFLPAFDMHHFTRLRSLSLNLYYLRDELNPLLEPITACPLLSLVVSTHGYYNLNQKTTALLSAIVTLPRLRKLSLTKFKLIIDDSAPIAEYALQHLEIDACTCTQYRNILHRYLQLREFIIEDLATETIDQGIVLSASETDHSALKYLSVKNCHLPIENLQSVLSWTPSLVDLTLTTTQSVFDSIFEGHFWEEFITVTLPFLKHFKFSFRYVNTNSVAELSLESIITPFRTSFWLNEKHWLVSCNYTFRMGPEAPSEIILYTTWQHKAHSNVYLRCTASPMESHSIRRKTYRGEEVCIWFRVNGRLTLIVH
jgi:hypothetical protein